MVFQEPSVGVGSWDKAVSRGKRASKERPMLSAGGGIRGCGKLQQGVFCRARAETGDWIWRDKRFVVSLPSSLAVVHS